jgi:hypothetical protein
MKRAIAGAATLLGVFLTAASAGAAEPKAIPTFNKDVAPILFRNCATCHRPNQIAPMSLLSYQDARPWAKAIKVKVQAREMPPWFSDPRFGEFSNDTSLTQAEIDTIAAWADAGAPAGVGSAPALPTFAEAGWRHPSGRVPDLIIELPIEWKIAAEGEMPNFNLYTPIPFNEPKLIEAIQVLPGNIEATHHVTVAATNLPEGTVLGTGPAWPGGPVTDYVPVAAREGVRVDNTLLEDTRGRDAADEQDATGDGLGGAYIPGTGAAVSRPGLGKWVRADRFKYIRWNLHFQATGRPETARPTLGLWWQTGQVTNFERRAQFETQMSEGKQLVEDVGKAKAPRSTSNLNPLLAPIPPYAANWTVTSIVPIRDDVTLYSLSLHMHLRGKDVTYVLTYPNGREQVLLRVPKYDFNWQLPYELKEPLKVPAGSTIKAIARYDNSVNNRFNPAPNKEVYWSEQSWDDMFLPGAQYTIDRLEKKPQAVTQGAQQD